MFLRLGQTRGDEATKQHFDRPHVAVHAPRAASFRGSAVRGPALAERERPHPQAEWRPIRPRELRRFERQLGELRYGHEIFGRHRALVRN